MDSNHLLSKRKLEEYWLTFIDLDSAIILFKLYTCYSKETLQENKSQHLDDL